MHFCHRARTAGRYVMGEGNCSLNKSLKKAAIKVIMCRH